MHSNRRRNRAHQSSAGASVPAKPSTASSHEGFVEHGLKVSVQTYCRSPGAVYPHNNDITFSFMQINGFYGTFVVALFLPMKTSRVEYVLSFKTALRSKRTFSILLLTFKLKPLFLFCLILAARYKTDVLSLLVVKAPPEISSRQKNCFLHWRLSWKLSLLHIPVLLLTSCLYMFPFTSV